MSVPSSLSHSPALFNTFPELESRLPWMSLLTGPTPIDRWPRSGSRLSEILIKRDDLADDRYGGNKARKFEFILGDLQAKGFREFWTVGGLCSNHCTAAAVYAHAANLKVCLSYVPTPLDRDELDLLKLQMFLNADQRMLPGGWKDWLGLLESLLLGGPGPYLVPPGGSSTAGVFGYVNAGLELAAQVHDVQTPLPDVIYIAGASHGTVMGLQMGLRLGRLDAEIVAVETVTPAWQRSRWLLPTPYLAYRRLLQLSPAAARVLPPFRTLTPRQDHRFEHLALGEKCPAVERAILRGREEFRIEMDSHFSGKAFAAMLQDIESGRFRGKTILFWHTHGKVNPNLLRQAQASAVKLPAPVAAAAQRNLRP